MVEAPEYRDQFPHHFVTTGIPVQALPIALQGWQVATLL